MTFQTEGERLLRRELAKEERAEIPHYVTGQHRAVIVEDDTHIIAVLSFVNAFGVAVRMMARRKPGEAWEVYGQTGCRAGLEVNWGPSPIPEDFRFSSLMKDALNKAEIEWMERFAEDG